VIKLIVSLAGHRFHPTFPSIAHSANKSFSADEYTSGTIDNFTQVPLVIQVLETTGSESRR
jgi:hypothetical protein